MDKTQFITTLTATRAAWEALLAQVEAGQMLQPGAAGKWSVNDMIAHITWNEQEILPIIQTHAVGGDAGLWDLSEEERNEHVYHQYRDVPLSTILANAQQSYGQVLEAAQALSDEDLNQPGCFAGMPADWVPWRLFAGCSFQHYQDHMPSIRAWLAHCQEPG